MVESKGIVGNIVGKVSREELEECIDKRYRRRGFREWYVFVHAVLEMLREGMLPEEMIEEFEKNKEMGVSITDYKTMYKYVSDILDMYPEIKETFYKSLGKRIDKGEIPKNRNTFWKGRFLEDLIYDSLQEIVEEWKKKGIENEIVVLPIYKIRIRSGSDGKQGRKSDADKIADILIIDWTMRLLIVIELKNLWEPYHNKNYIAEQAMKLPTTVSDEGLGIILSRIRDGRIPGKKKRKLSNNLIKVGWEILCEREDNTEYQAHVKTIKYHRFRKVYVWFHAGAPIDGLEMELDRFEEERDIEILRVFVNEPLYYTSENKKLVKEILEILYGACNNEETKTLEFDREGAIVFDKSNYPLGFCPVEVEELSTSGFKT